MKNILWLLLLCTGPVADAQSIKISGTVKDSLGNPLESANIVASKKGDGEMVNFAIAGHGGKYAISLPQTADYILTASFLGMKPLSVEISPDQPVKDLIVDFNLLPDETQLEGVELVYKMPVTVRGDTITYNADSFTSGNEKKLGDVLKKLPGLEVTDEGEVEVEGKKVSKIMVEGKDFFDGDSKLATKNIPADALSQVEILKNYNEVGQMRGLGNDQENTAINIKLKEGKKNFWFGETDGAMGGGDKTRYLGSAKTFYYSPKGSINLIGNLNNTGDVPFTFRDHMNFSGGFRSFNNRGGTFFNISESDLGFLVAQNEKAKEQESEFGAVNFSAKASDHWDISGFTLFSANRTDFVENSLKRYIQSGAREENNSATNQRNHLGMAKISSVYKPCSEFQLDYDLFVKLSDQKEVSDVLSVFSDDNGPVQNPIIERKENAPFSINQNINAYYTLSDRHIFAGYLQHLYQDEDPYYEAIVALQPFIDILPLDESVDVFDLNQEKNIKTDKLDSRIDYYYILNDKSNLNLSIGATRSRQDFNSSIFQIPDPGTANDLDDADFNNDVTYNFTDLFFGLHYKFKTGIFTFTPGLTLHNYITRTSQLESPARAEQTMLLPDVFAIAQFKQSESLRFHYEMTANYTDVINLAEGYVFNNYNSLFRGNGELENASFHSLGLGYFNFNMFNFTNMNIGVNYVNRVNAIRNNTSLVRINQVATPVNSDFPDETFNAFGRFQKTFRKLKANLQTNISLENLNLIVNDEQRESQNFTRSYRASIETNFKNAPNFEVGYRRSINQYKNGGITSTYYTDRPFANGEINFLKGFTLTADYSYFHYYDKASTVRNEYSFLEAALFYRSPGSKWEFRIEGNNLLDTDSINRDSFNENFNSTTAYFIQPRMLMLGIKYML